MPKEIISTSEAPAALGPYSQATSAGGFIFVSGQVAIDPKAGKLIEGTIVEQTRQIMKNIGAILEKAGASYSDIVKCDIFVTDLGQFKAINAVYAEFFESEPPARATIEVSALPLGVNVEIAAIAYVSSQVT
ncbi:MAG: RidA family protein [Candidatus Coatesbacteria bacterium]|nr:RidA family protein [Candidatus Coatesbacteria bacterium]